jgi:hypothetical protein
MLAWDTRIVVVVVVVVDVECRLSNVECRLSIVECQCRMSNVVPLVLIGMKRISFDLLSEQRCDVKDEGV